MNWLVNKFEQIAENIKSGKYGDAIYEFDPIQISEREALTAYLYEKDSKRRIVCKIVEHERDGDLDVEWFNIDITSVDALIDVLKEAKAKA